MKVSPRIVESFELQAEACRKLGSPMYDVMLRAATDDLIRDGVVAWVVRDFDLDPVAGALPLRLMGGVHRLVLMGIAEDLASHYPTMGGTPDGATLADSFLATVGAHRGYVRDSLDVAPQTNDVGRSAPLIAGLFSVAGGARSIRLLEIGSAGGLNLLLDRYRYEAGTWSWGEPTAAATIRVGWEGSAPPTMSRLPIDHRRGCDVMPLDISNPEQQLRLLSFIWPDQVERFERTRGAISAAAPDPPIVDRSEAPRWLGASLAESVNRRTLTVVQHSVMWQYLDSDAQQAVEAVIEEAGSRATRTRPFAHISFEPAPDGYRGEGMVLRTVSWPGRHERVLGRGHPHGAWFRWEP